MPFILGILALAAGVYIWIIRARNAAVIAKEVANVPKDLMLAARRFGFKRRANRHPVDDVEDRNLAIAAIASGFMELGTMPTQEDRQRLMVQTQSVLNVSKPEAEELIVLGHWLVSQCGTPASGVDRIARRLNKFAGADPVADLLTLVKKSVGEDWNPDQLDGLNTIKRAFHLS